MLKTKDDLLVLGEILKNNEYPFLSSYLLKLKEESTDKFSSLLNYYFPHISLDSEMSKSYIEEIGEFLYKEIVFLTGDSWIDRKDNVYTKNDSHLSITLSPNKIYLFGVVCSAIIFIYIFAVTFFSSSIPENSLRFVDQSLGNMYAIINTVIGFFFGNAYRGTLNDKNDK